MAAISDYAELKLLDTISGTAFSVTNSYCSLHDGAFGEDGSNEITGGSYARQGAISWAAAATGAKSTSALLQFTDVPAVGGGGITDVGVWDASSVGNALWGGAVTTPKTTNAGDTVEIASGNLTLSLD
jgi:hypothetical protein